MDRSGQLHVLITLLPAKQLPLPTEQEAVLGPVLVWMVWRREDSLAFARNQM